MLVNEVTYVSQNKILPKHLSHNKVSNLYCSPSLWFLSMSEWRYLSRYGFNFQLFLFVTVERKYVWNKRWEDIKYELYRFLRNMYSFFSKWKRIISRHMFYKELANSWWCICMPICTVFILRYSHIMQICLISISKTFCFSFRFS